MFVYYLKNPNVTEPRKAHKDDAGADIFASSGPKIVGNMASVDCFSSIDYIEYGTNLFLEPHPHQMPSTEIRTFSLDLRPRSSISKMNLLMANSPATIDISYRGEVKVRFKYIVQPEDLVSISNRVACKVNYEKIYAIGDRIAQILPHLQEDIKWIQVDNLNETSRGEGGFGSTGK